MTHSPDTATLTPYTDRTAAFPLLPVLFALLMIPAALLFVHGFLNAFPIDQWGTVPYDGQGVASRFQLNRIIGLNSVLPRSVIALMSGFALGLAGVVFQQVLRNRMASPATVGAAGGAQLALALCILYAPGLMEFGRFWVALAGSMLSVGAVLALSWRQKLAPLPLILAGMIVTLTGGAIASGLVLLHEQYLVSLFMWGSGSLIQNDWSGPLHLAPWLILGGIGTVLLARPVMLLELGDEAARSLGVPLMAIRFAALTVAVVLSAAVISAVGMFGFIGLAGPTLASFAGARTFRQRLIWSPLLAMGILWLTDQVVALTDGWWPDLIPTGAVTAMFGAPLILFLLPHMRSEGGLWTGAISVFRAHRPWARVGLIGITVVVLTVAALAYGRGPDGWSWAHGSDLMQLLPWRWPRTMAALAAGAMLAASGMVMQRLTGNPMASPEVLGITSGAAIGMILMLYTYPGASGLTHIVAASVGALGVLLAILTLSRKSAFSPDRIILAGIALGALFDALTAVLTANGDPRALILLNWTLGSTYRVGADQALLTGAIAVILLGLAPLTVRWLTILPLGDASARSLGVDMRRSRLILLCLTAMMTAAATLVVGPLSFIGLMAPHLARMLGLNSAASQLAGAILTGAGVMVAADWVGRMALFPFQIPAGLMATLFGAPLVMILLSRKESR